MIESTGRVLPFALAGGEMNNTSGRRYGQRPWVRFLRTGNPQPPSEDKEKGTGGGCTLTGTRTQSKMHHRPPDAYTYSENQCGNRKKVLELQKLQHGAFENKPNLNYKEHCKKHENHCISAVLFSTPLRYKTGLRATSSLLFVCLLDGYSQEWQLLLQQRR